MLEDSKQRIFDVCIIGSGPAGIISALEFSNLNPSKTVLLIEYGKRNGNIKNDLDESIIVKNVINHYSPYEITNKGFGGTTATWGGRCVMFDKVDFINRPVIQSECTWDTDLLDETEQYLSKAAEYFECGRPLFNLKETALGKKRIAEGFIEGDVIDSVVERWSKPTRFGKRYFKELKKCLNITLLEGYEARDFKEPDSDGKVSSLTIRNISNHEVKEVSARQFILAAGTQETTRLLLRNKKLFKHLGSAPAALGKYYQGHISGKIASVKFNGDPAKTDYGFIKDPDGVYIRRRFQFTTDFLIKNNLLNTAIWLDNSLYHDPKHTNGAMSFMYMAMITPFLGSKLAPPAIAESITKGKVQELHKHIFNIIKDLPGSLLIPASIFYRRYCLNRKLPGVFLYNKHNRYALHFHSEQIPLASNKMELEKDGETLNICYNVTDEDIKSVIAVHEKLDDWLRTCGCGQLEYWYAKKDLADNIKQMSRDGIHQCGTTRIADSAQNGVVDRNLKLFGTKNVFICSSSVFPTSGQANPTFFLGAFAIRLAHYLSSFHEKN